MSTAAGTLPGWLAGRFGAAVAEAGARGERLRIEPIPGVFITVLPEFYDLPSPRVLTLLVSIVRAKARLFGIDISHILSGGAISQAAPLSPDGAAGGDPRQQPAGRAAASAPETDPAGCVILNFRRP